MIRCKPERNTKQITVILVVTILIFLCIALAKSGLAEYGYGWIYDIAMLVEIAVGFSLLYRYSMCEYEYVLEGGSFTVERKVGSKVTVYCSLDLETAIRLVPKEQYCADIKSGAYAPARIRYSLCQNIKTKSFVYMAEFNGAVASVEFEPNEIFVSEMIRLIDEAKHGN